MDGVSPPLAPSQGCEQEMTSAETTGRRHKAGRRRTGNEEPERGTRPWNEARETLQPYPNSVMGTGNEDPPCVDMGGTSDPISRCIIIGN